MYWAEKRNVLKIYNKPPLLDSSESISAVRLIKMSALIHMFFGFLMFSHPFILTYDFTDDEVWGKSFAVFTKSFFSRYLFDLNKTD